MAASNLQVFLVGASGRTYALDGYQPDAVGGLVTMSASGLAGTSSPTSWRAPENCVLKDVSITTGATAVGITLSVNNAIVNGGQFRTANFLPTLATRPKINIPIRAGDWIGFTNF